LTDEVRRMKRSVYPSIIRASSIKNYTVFLKLMWGMIVALRMGFKKSLKTLKIFN